MPGKKYGWRHQQVRARWAPVVAGGGVACARCGVPILPGTSWDLGHVDGDPHHYQGPEHRKCNRGARPGKPRDGESIPRRYSFDWDGADGQVAGEPRRHSREW
jgi:hypothetical protein